MTQVRLYTCKEAASSNDGELELNFHCYLLAVADDNGDVEEFLYFAVLFLFVTRQLSIGRGSRMRDNS